MVKYNEETVDIEHSIPSNAFPSIIIKLMCLFLQLKNQVPHKHDMDSVMKKRNCGLAEKRGQMKCQHFMDCMKQIGEHLQHIFYAGEVGEVGEVSIVLGSTLRTTPVASVTLVLGTGAVSGATPAPGSAERVTVQLVQRLLSTVSARPAAPLTNAYLLVRARRHAACAAPLHHFIPRGDTLRLTPHTHHCHRYHLRCCSQLSPVAAPVGCRQHTSEGEREGDGEGERQGEVFPSARPPPPETGEGVSPPTAPPAPAQVTGRLPTAAGAGAATDKLSALLHGPTGPTAATAASQWARREQKLARSFNLHNTSHTTHTATPAANGYHWYQCPVVIKGFHGV